MLLAPKDNIQIPLGKWKGNVSPFVGTLDQKALFLNCSGQIVFLGLLIFCVFDVFLLFLDERLHINTNIDKKHALLIHTHTKSIPLLLENFAFIEDLIIENANHLVFFLIGSLPIAKWPIFVSLFRLANSSRLRRYSSLIIDLF
jgi:hypothetical protein